MKILQESVNIDADNHFGIRVENRLPIVAQGTGGVGVVEVEPLVIPFRVPELCRQQVVQSILDMPGKRQVALGDADGESVYRRIRDGGVIDQTLGEHHIYLVSDSGAYVVVVQDFVDTVDGGSDFGLGHSHYLFLLVVLTSSDITYYTSYERICQGVFEKNFIEFTLRKLYGTLKRFLIWDLRFLT